MAQVEARTAARPTDGIIDTACYPLHDPAGANAQKLVSRCRKDLVDTGSFNLTGFLPGATVARSEWHASLMSAVGTRHHA